MYLHSNVLETSTFINFWNIVIFDTSNSHEQDIYFKTVILYVYSVSGFLIIMLTSWEGLVRILGLGGNNIWATTASKMNDTIKNIISWPKYLDWKTMKYFIRKVYTPRISKNKFSNPFCWVPELYCLIVDRKPWWWRGKALPFIAHIER